MNEHLETMTANLKAAQGKIADAQIAAEKLPPSQASDDLRDAIESTLDELTWALHYIGKVAQQAVSL